MSEKHWGNPALSCWKKVRIITKEVIRIEVPVAVEDQTER